MEVIEHITALEREGQRFADAARRSGLDADVPDCPGWDVRELVRHLGMIHLWAAAHVAFPHEPYYETEEEEHAAFTKFWPDLGVFWVDDADLVDWYVKTNVNLVESLRAASPDVESWTFLPAPTPRAMWARRQAHETAVHRFDAEHATGAETGFDPAFADDGVDEILAAFAPRKRSLPTEASSTMLVHASDTDTRWHVTMSSDGFSTVKESGPADVSLTGPASDLYLAMWNRGGDSNIQIEGDRKVLDFWHANHRVRWS